MVAQVLHMLRLLSKSLDKDLLHLFAEEVRVIIERVVHHLMGKLVHQLVMLHVLFGMAKLVLYFNNLFVEIGG